MGNIPLGWDITTAWRRRQLLPVSLDRCAFGRHRHIRSFDCLVAYSKPPRTDYLCQIRHTAIAGTPNCVPLPIGTYTLNMSIHGLSGLTEFTDAEYSIYERQFDGEKDFNAPAMTFLKRQWKVSLGTVKGIVYKIAL